MQAQFENARCSKIQENYAGIIGTNIESNTTLKHIKVAVHVFSQLAQN